MNIINIGGWYVGNTAVLDWMDGFEEISFVKGDFDILRLEDGIMDMINTPNREIKIAMIEKNKVEFYLYFFRKTKNFIGRYTKNIFKKSSSATYNSFYSYQKLLYLYLTDYEHKIRKGIVFDELGFWKEWLNKVSLIFSDNKSFRSTVYQNPFFYDELFDKHNNIWPSLLDPYKLVFVHRDPLDQFADIVSDNAHLLTHSKRFHGGTEAMHPADRFLVISKKIYNARLRMANNYTKEQLVIFSFEDFLQEHDRITNGLKIFFNIKTERDPSNKRFVIEESLRNIGKGRDSQEVRSLLIGKDYVMDEINYLRENLIAHNNSI